MKLEPKPRSYLLRDKLRDRRSRFIISLFIIFFFAGGILTLLWFTPHDPTQTGEEFVEAWNSEGTELLDEIFDAATKPSDFDEIYDTLRRAGWLFRRPVITHTSEFKSGPFGIRNPYEFHHRAPPGLIVTNWRYSLGEWHLIDIRLSNFSVGRPFPSSLLSDLRLAWTRSDASAVNAMVRRGEGLVGGRVLEALSYASIDEENTLASGRIEWTAQLVFQFHAKFGLNQLVVTFGYADRHWAIEDIEVVRNEQ